MVEMEAPKHVILELYTPPGILVCKEVFKQIQLVDNEIDVHGMSPGVYFLRITADHMQQTFLLVVD